VGGVVRGVSLRRRPGGRLLHELVGALGTPLTVSTGFVMRVFAKRNEPPAESATAVVKAALFFVSRKTPIPWISRASLRRAPVPTTSKAPYCDSTMKRYMYPSVATGSFTL